MQFWMMILKLIMDLLKNLMGETAEKMNMTTEELKEEMPLLFEDLTTLERKLHINLKRMKDAVILLQKEPEKGESKEKYEQASKMLARLVGSEIEAIEVSAQEGDEAQYNVASTRPISGHLKVYLPEKIMQLMKTKKFFLGEAITKMPALIFFRQGRPGFDIYSTTETYQDTVLAAEKNYTYSLNSMLLRNLIHVNPKLYMQYLEHLLTAEEITADAAFAVLDDLMKKKILGFGDWRWSEKSVSRVAYMGTRTGSEAENFGAIKVEKDSWNMPDADYRKWRDYVAQCLGGKDLGVEGVEETPSQAQAHTGEMQQAQEQAGGGPQEPTLENDMAELEERCKREYTAARNETERKNVVERCREERDKIRDYYQWEEGI